MHTRISASDTTTEISFEVVSERLQGKGRVRSGNGFHYTPERTKRYERLVRQCYLDKLRELGMTEFIFEAPVIVQINAYYPIPKSEIRAMKTMMRNGEVVPVVKPDVDNIAKIILDALNGVAYIDDTQVVELVSDRVRYSDKARVTVTIKEYTKQQTEEMKMNEPKYEIRKDYNCQNHNCRLGMATAVARV